MFFYKSDSKVLISSSELSIDGLKVVKANTVDAAVEKHVPLISVDGNNVVITVGEVLHPMLEEHYIEFVVIETSCGYQVHYLKPGEEPIAVFLLSEGETLLNAYCYCNLHGLWMSSSN